MGGIGMSDKSITDKLLDIKEKIEEAKNSKAKAEGKLEEHMSRLKKEFGVTSIAQAENKLVKLEKEEAALEKELNEGMEELEKEYAL